MKWKALMLSCASGGQLSLSVCWATLIFPSCNLPLLLIFNQAAPSAFQRGLCRSPQPFGDASRMDATCTRERFEVCAWASQQCPLSFLLSQSKIFFEKLSRYAKSSKPCPYVEKNGEENAVRKQWMATTLLLAKLPQHYINHYFPVLIIFSFL